MQSNAVPVFICLISFSLLQPTSVRNKANVNTGHTNEILYHCPNLDLWLVNFMALIYATWIAGWYQDSILFWSNFSIRRSNFFLLARKLYWIITDLIWLYLLIHKVNSCDGVELPKAIITFVTISKKQLHKAYLSIYDIFPFPDIIKTIQTVCFFLVRSTGIDEQLRDRSTTPITVTLMSRTDHDLI